MMLFQAIADATKAIAANPADVDAYKKRVMLLIRMGQIDDAINDLDTVIGACEVKDAEIYQFRGALRLQKGDKEGALQDIKEAVRLKPELLQKLSGDFKLDEGQSCH